MIIAPPEALVSLFAGWAKLFSHSKVVPTIVTFLHIAPVIVGGGFAISLDRATLRAVRGTPDERRLHLGHLGMSHRTVVAALTLSLVSGLALLTADLETFLGSRIYWAKMSLVVLLLANGWLITRTEQRLGAAGEQGGADLWGRLRVLAMASLFLWLAISFAGVALVNAG